jgi:hypothetical protein
MAAFAFLAVAAVEFQCHKSDPIMVSIARYCTLKTRILTKLLIKQVVAEEGVEPSR